MWRGGRVRDSPLTLPGPATMDCVCSQPSSLGAMSRGRRYFVFLVAMAETMLWSGTIFGWASLVHVLKVQGVYSNLCPDHAHTTALNTTAPTHSHNKVSSRHGTPVWGYRTPLHRPQAMYSPVTAAPRQPASGRDADTHTHTQTGETRGGPDYEVN